MTMEEKVKEVRHQMLMLGYYQKGNVELEMMDEDRGKVIWDGHLTIGIYDFIKHTFVD